MTQWMLVKNGHRARIVAVVLLALLTELTACSSKKDVELAQQAVIRFHSQFNAEQYHSIYDEADAKFRATGNETEITAFLQAIHRKLGRTQQAELQGTQIQWLAGQGTFVVLGYQTKFSDDTGVESFTWRIDNGRALLVGYNVNSKALILK